MASRSRGGGKKGLFCPIYCGCNDRALWGCTQLFRPRAPTAGEDAARALLGTLEAGIWRSMDSLSLSLSRSFSSSLSFSLCLFLYFFIFLCLSLTLVISPSPYISLSLSLSLSLYLFIYFIYFFIHLNIFFLYLCLSTFLFSYVSFYPSTHLSTYLLF